MFVSTRITRCCLGSTARTLARLPLSRPAITSTVSFLATCTASSPQLQHFRCERDDLHVVLVAQLARDRAEDARALRVEAVGQDHRRVLVEADIRAVGAPILLGHTHHDCPDDIAFLDRSAGHRLLHRGDDNITDGGGILAPREHPDAHQLAGPGIIGNVEACLLPNHRESPWDSPPPGSSPRARRRIWVTIQCFSLLSGRDSMIST